MKHFKKIRIWVGILLLFTALAIPFTPPMQTYLSIPNQIATFDNQPSVDIPALGQNVHVDAAGKSVKVMNSSNFYAESPGNSELFYEFAGLPIKKVDVSVLKDIRVIPGGQSIGVQLHTLGVLVVGHHQVEGKNGMVSPGEKANIKVGDIIMKINGKKIKEMEDVKPLVEKAGEQDKPLKITIKRGEEKIKTSLKPVLGDKEEYRIGLYIRDSAAGIGTMTFYDPKTKKYGALGHVISDMDTQQPIEIYDGTIVRSTVTSIDKGNNGSPGEKQATFSIEEDKIGSISKNSKFGIFGKLSKPLSNGNEKYDEPMPVALSQEVKEGPAKILTVIDGEKVEEFDIEIVSSVPQKTPSTKGMIIEITDKELLKKTGGIVQGMSGSPIIQNGKIVGAVTHVFVNDPTSGYGVHIEWMLQEAGLINVNEKKDKAS